VVNPIVLIALCSQQLNKILLKSLITVSWNSRFYFKNLTILISFVMIGRNYLIRGKLV